MLGEAGSSPGAGGSGGGAGPRRRGDAVATAERGDTYQITYPIFFLFIFFPILLRYVSVTYRWRIRIGYVSDTGYAHAPAYRGIGAGDVFSLNFPRV